jgi:hypothetical protein
VVCHSSIEALSHLLKGFEMNLFPTVAALSDDKISIYCYKSKEYRQRAVPPSINLFDILNLADVHQVNTFWIVPGSELSMRAGRGLGAISPCDANVVGIRASQNKNGSPNFLHMWRTSGSFVDRRTIKVGFPEHDDRWPWVDITDPSILLRTVLYLQDALECEIEWSPGHTSRSIIQKLNTGQREQWLRAAALPDVMKDTKNFAKDLREHRSLTDAERRPGQFLHIFDKNSQYLAAATSTNLGEGSPDYACAPIAERQYFDAKLPGLWQAWIQSDHWLAHRYEGQNWFWTPEYEYLLRNGAITDEGACHYWPRPRYHETLRTWGESLWKARQVLKSGVKPQFEDGKMVSGSKYAVTHAREFAYNATKMVAVQGLGWLAHEPTRGDYAQYYRPDWWNMVVSSAVAKMLWKIRTLASANINTCYVEVDALGCVSSDADSREAFPVLYDRQGNLGAFKHALTVPVSDDLVDLFNDSTPRSGHKRLHQYLLDQEKELG